MPSMKKSCRGWRKSCSWSWKWKSMK